MNNRAMFFVRWAFALCLLLAASPADLAVQAAPDARFVSALDCVDFESLPASAAYAVGAVFTDSGVTVTPKPFTWSNSTVFNGGTAIIGSAGQAGGTGQEINTNNINLDFDFGVVLDGLQFSFGEYGGNLNIEVNGEFKNFENFVDIQGTVIGGVNVSVTGGLGNDTGTVKLSGLIKQFAVGGQELWIDNLCPETGCLDFESLTVGTRYIVGDTLSDSGYDVLMKNFQWANGTVFGGGYAEVNNTALSGGWGLDLQLNNINASLVIPRALKELSLDFGEYGGNLNIEINGVFMNFENFVDVHGTVNGGVKFSVTNGLGNDRGQLVLNGLIHSFAIGGQELWIDNVCTTPAERVYLPLIIK